MKSLEIMNNPEFTNHFEKMKGIANNMTIDQKKFAYHGLLYRITAMQAHAGGSSDIWWFEAAKTAQIASLFSNGDTEWKRYLLKSLLILGEVEDILQLTSGFDEHSASESFNQLYRAWLLETIGEKQEIIDAYNKLAHINPAMKSDIELRIKEIDSDPDRFSSDITQLIEKLKKLNKKENPSLLASINKRICYLGDTKAIECVCDSVFPKNETPSYWQLFDAHLLSRPLAFVGVAKTEILRELYASTTNPYCATTIAEVMVRRGSEADVQRVLNSETLKSSDKFKVLVWADKAHIRQILTDYADDMKDESNYCLTLLGKIGGDDAARMIIEIGEWKLKDGEKMDSLLFTGSPLAYEFIKKEIVDKKNRNAGLKLMNLGMDMCGGIDSFDILETYMKSGDSELSKLALKTAATIAHLDLAFYARIHDIVGLVPSLASEFEIIKEKGYLIQMG